MPDPQSLASGPGLVGAPTPAAQQSVASPATTILTAADNGVQPAARPVAAGPGLAVAPAAPPAAVAAGVSPQAAAFATAEAAYRSHLQSLSGVGGMAAPGVFALPAPSPEDAARMATAAALSKGYNAGLIKPSHIASDGTVQALGPGVQDTKSAAEAAAFAQTPAYARAMDPATRLQSAANAAMYGGPGLVTPAATPAAAIPINAALQIGELQTRRQAQAPLVKLQDSLTAMSQSDVQKFMAGAITKDQLEANEATRNQLLAGRTGAVMPITSGMAGYGG